MLAWGYILQDLHGYRDLITLEYWALPSYKFFHLVKLLLVRYSNTCLRLFYTRFTLFTEISSQRWSFVYYTLPSYQFPHLVELLLVIYSNACLRLFIVILQDLHCLQRSYHNVDHGGLSFTITPISTFSGALVSEIQ